MKKLFFVLTLLLMAVPAWSAITIDIEQTDAYIIEEGDAAGLSFVEAILSYDVNGSSVPRAWALTIETDDPNTEIDWIFRTGATDSEQGYWVTPSNIEISDGEVGEWGPPSVFDEGLEVRVIEIASLYEAGGDGPPDVCGLVGLEIIGPNDGSTVCLDIGIEAVRGGVIDEALGSLEIDPNDPLCVVMAEAGPECWAYPCFGCGDSTGDGAISSADALIIVNAWPPKDYDECADYSQDGQISSADALIIVNHWPPKEECPVADGCSEE